MSDQPGDSAPPEGPDDPRHAELAALREAVVAGRLGEDIVARFLDQGTALLGDDSPMLLGHRHRTDLERVLGRDPGSLRVHTGHRAGEAADAMGARAFAIGDRDIFLGPAMAGRLHTAEGRAVLAHEAVHTMRAGDGVGFSHPHSAARSREEAIARSVEQRVLAEDDGYGDVKLHEGPAAVPEQADPDDRKEGLVERLKNMPLHQLNAIEERVAAILQERSRFEADRFGLPVNKG